jgi:hypothetical protein
MSGLVTAGSDGAGRRTALVVASSEAVAAVRATADYVCDGTADQVQINAAIATGAGTVMLSGGRFWLSAPITANRSGMSLLGSGRFLDQSANSLSNGGGTGLVVASGFSGTAALLVDGGRTDAMLGSVTVRDLSVNGAGIGSGVHGIRFSSFHGLMDNVDVYSCTGHGVYVYGYNTTDQAVNWATYDSKLTNITTSYNTLAGLALLHNAADVQVANVVSHHNLHGMWIDSSSPQITNFHCYSNSQQGIWLDGGGPARTKLMNGKIEHSGKNGLFCDGTGGTSQSGLQVIGVGFNSNSEAVNDDSAHISAPGTGGLYSATFIGCTFGNSDGVANKPWTAVFVAAQARYVNMQGCNFDFDGKGGANAVPYIDSGCLATSRFLGNIGLAAQGAG